MTLTNRCLAGLAALTLSAGILAAPVEVSGIKLADPVELAGSRLQLNGAGIRYKAVFKVYVAALYLEKGRHPEEAFAAPGAKRMSITLLRETDSNELGKSFTKAFEDNAPKTEMSRLIPGLLKMGQVFSDQKKNAGRRKLHHRLDSRHRHGDFGQRQAAGQADQGSRVLQRHAAHLARAQAGRL